MNAPLHPPPRPETAAPPAEAMAVIAFWREAGPKLWFAKDPDFDRRFRDCFLALHEAAVRGGLDDWAETPEGALALVLLLDQFPRNAFRGTQRMYATDAVARAVASAAVGAGRDRQAPEDLVMFMYLPFGHAENEVDQDLSVSLARRLPAELRVHAEEHRSIIRRFGRFPHRNAILGRKSTRDERRFLDEGGFAG